MKVGNNITTREVKQLLREYANESMKYLIDKEILAKLLAYQAHLRAQNIKNQD